MDETNRTTPPVSETPEVEPEPRWPVCMTFLTTWCMPATSARRTAHAGLGWAYLVHVLAAITGVLLIIFFVAAAESSGSFVEILLYEFPYVLREIASQIAQRPKVRLLQLTASVGFIELGFLAVGLLTTPWGAQDEPIRSSFTNGLRRTWLHTTHVLVAVLLVGTPVTMLSQAETAWDFAYFVTAPEWPEAPANDVPKDSQAWKDYQQAQQRYADAYYPWQAEMESKKPWYFRNIEIFVANGCVLSAFWIVWALLRAVGAPRRAPPMVRPPTCEACGYNLTAIPMESRCPECGEPVIRSLGPDVRPGTLWERRREVGRLVAWWRCCVDSFSQPKQFGRKIRIVTPGMDHRRFLAVHLPIVFLLSTVGVSVLIGSQMRGFLKPTIQEFVEFVLMPGSIVGCVGVLIALAIPMLAALLVGLWFYLQDKRNLLVGSMQVASYLAGYLTLWVTFAWVMLGVVIALGEARWLGAAETLTGIDQELLGFFTLLIPNLVCAVAYFGLVARGTAALRYANR